ncbi:MAG: preprotein translocase subunit SecA [Bifidobacteriaceae bacterium]|jgi:preprotein translocase subunit SecA|nr:preprotein translocase subunit SecA [Bifidobacteriaceae bacterium]
MVKLIDKIFRAGEGKLLKELDSLASQVDELEGAWSDLSDEEISAMTDDFKFRLKNGETLDELLPEAFATVREASKRTIGQRHYHVQLMGGAALHLGNISEMKTGEGKTLVGTLPSYLNALTGKSVHIITVNDYLASYQADLMRPIFKMLGMTVGTIVSGQNPRIRREMYACDIVYGTNNEFGFDYLRDNGALEIEQQVQKDHYFAIVDEVDSILIDEARTPLIISGPANSNLIDYYIQFAKIVRSLEPGIDYEIDEKKRTAGILEGGIAKVEEMTGIENIYTAENTHLIRFINNAIKAKELFAKDKEYIVQNGQVKIVDEHTGRIMEGRRFNDGMHQAIEAKEGVQIKQEDQTIASITLQNYFRMYEKLAGMTGTAETEAAEFMSTYGMRVVPIPTNKPMSRIDQLDLVYQTEKGKFMNVIADIQSRYEVGQPVLAGTISVEKSELLSKLLTEANIPHNVLNAKNHLNEAKIIAGAGRLGQVTIATNMAGRGTDIMLGGNSEFTARESAIANGFDPDVDFKAFEKEFEKIKKKLDIEVEENRKKVLKLGGLYVLGTERHESRRIDNQLQGRSGRQGDPGESRFYLSFEDDLMRIAGGDSTKRLLDTINIPEDVPIEHNLITKTILRAQTSIEGRNFEIRKNILKYDDVMNKQRSVIYSQRQAVLEGEDVTEEFTAFIPDVAAKYVSQLIVNDKDGYNFEKVFERLRAVYPSTLTLDEVAEAYGGVKALTPEDVIKEISSDIEIMYNQKFEALGNEAAQFLERQALLISVDLHWRDHLYEMDYLREGIGLRSLAQRDPIVEYTNEGSLLFASMMEDIKLHTIIFYFRAQVVSNQPASEGDEEQQAKQEISFENMRQSQPQNRAQKRKDAKNSASKNKKAKKEAIKAQKNSN